MLSVCIFRKPYIYYLFILIIIIIMFLIGYAIWTTIDHYENRKQQNNTTQQTDNDQNTPYGQTNYNATNR